MPPSRALTGGIIGGAGLDDVEVETPANQLLNLRLPNLKVTPHVAWASNQAIEEFRQQLVDNLEAFAAGNPQNAITALKEGALDC